MRKKLSIILLLAVSLLLSGCMKLVMRFEADGSGTAEIGFNMSITGLQSANQMSDTPDPDMERLLALMENPVTDEETGIGYSVEERLQNGSMWTYIVMSVPDEAAWAHLTEAGERMFPDDPAATDESGGSVDDAMAPPVITRDGSTLRVEIAVPPQGKTDAEADMFSAAMSMMMQMSYEIQMPGTLGEHNGQIDTLTNNPVWIIDQSSTEPLSIFVESTVE